MCVNLIMEPKTQEEKPDRTERKNREFNNSVGDFDNSL